MSSKPTTRPARSTVLPGREAPILPDPGEHVVLHAPLNGPWPRGAEVLHLAGGCSNSFKKSYNYLFVHDAVNCLFIISEHTALAE